MIVLSVAAALFVAGATAYICWPTPTRPLPASPTRALIAGPVALELPARTGAVAIDPANPHAVHDCNLHAPHFHVDPTVLEHVAPGPGSLSSLAQVGAGSLITITHADLVDPEIERRFAVVFDRRVRTLDPGEEGPAEAGDGIMPAFEAAIEPSMRKARLWLLQANAEHRGLASAWAAVESLQMAILGPTGEYPILTDPKYAAADLAEALLVS
jgi:hypothetical protein